MINHEIAMKLNEMADIFEYNKVQWKPRAYRTAARKIDSMGEDVSHVYKKEGRKGLENLNGVGESIADHIAEYLDTGKVKKWEKEKKKGFEGLHELIKVSGLGPNKIKQMTDELGIKSLKDLEKAINQEKVRKLKGFGKKTEENISDSIKQYKKSKDRWIISRAMQAAEDVIDELKDEVEQIDYAGSLRRMKETIGDVDLLAITKNSKKVMDKFTNMQNVHRVTVHGKTKSTVVLKDGINVDLRVLNKGSYGAALQYFTGSKDHSIELRNIAVKKGYKLSEYGLFKKKSGKKVESKDEKKIYEKLGLQYIEPELREARGEIEAAKRKRLPKLVGLNDIKGDLQMHTKYSDGSDPIKDMVKKAEEKGYEYIAITDHTKAQRIANGMDEKEIRKQWKEIDKIKSKVKILKGAEVDILDDGRLDYPDKLLKELDIVLVGVHSGFKASEKEMTDRIVKAFENKYVNIFVHPTGRVIGRREGYKVDMDRLFKAAKKNNVILEINSDPERLDLNDSFIMEAKKRNVKFSLGTDSHAASGLDNMKYGVGQARRGWLEKKHIINTKGFKELKKSISKNPG